MVAKGFTEEPNVFKTSFGFLLEHKIQKNDCMLDAPLQYIFFILLQNNIIIYTFCIFTYKRN